MTGLFAAEDPTLTIERLEHVPVADIGRDDANAALLHQPVETEIRHRRDRDEVDAEMKREHRDDLVAVDRLAALVHGKHPVAVAVERDTEVEVAAAHELLQWPEVG